MYASRSRCDSPSRFNFATSSVPSSSSARYTSPMQPPPRGRTESSRSPRCASTPSATTLSATSRQVPPADVVEQPLRGLFHQIKNVLELVGSSGVRVGDLPLGGFGGKVQEGTNHGAPSAECGDGAVVVLVHGEDVIEVLTVLRRDAPRPLGADVHPAKGGGVHSPAVGRRSDVPVASPSGVHENLAL